MMVVDRLSRDDAALVPDHALSAAGKISGKDQQAAVAFRFHPEQARQDVAAFVGQVFTNHHRAPSFARQTSDDDAVAFAARRAEQERCVIPEDRFAQAGRGPARLEDLASRLPEARGHEPHRILRQVGAVDHRELAQVLDRADVLRPDAALVHDLTIERDGFVSVTNQSSKTPLLQLLNLRDWPVRDRPLPQRDRCDRRGVLETRESPSRSGGFLVTQVILNAVTNTHSGQCR